MLKSCSYCGRIHDTKPLCNARLKAQSERKKRFVGKAAKTEQNSFRNKKAWQDKREHIKRRDNYLCQSCLHGLGIKGVVAYTTEKLQVHHIISLKSDINQGLLSDNLITLCVFCHELAEKGNISSEKLKEIAENNTTECIL